MSWPLLLSVALAAGALLRLALKLRGGGGRPDLTAPRKPKPKRLSTKELDDLTAPVARGEKEEALRRIPGGKLHPFMVPTFSRIALGEAKSRPLLRNLCPRNRCAFR